MSQWQPQQLQPWHLRVLDLLVANPALTNEEIAIELQVHPVTVSYLRRSDMFKLALEERQLRLSAAVDNFALDRIRGKVMKLAERAVDTLVVQVDNEHTLAQASQQGVSKGALEGCEMALRALGFIGQGAGAAPVQQTNISNSNVLVADATMLAEARQRMRERAVNASHEPRAIEALPAPAGL